MAADLDSLATSLGINPEEWAINLDCATIDPDELEQLGDVLTNLGAYARLKARATRSRERGYIGNAENLEARCDALYKKLPSWARW